MHEFFFKKLRNPARDRRAGAMRQFCPGQLDSTAVTHLQQHVPVHHDRAKVYFAFVRAREVSFLPFGFALLL